MKKENKLIKNTLIFSIGNFSSKLLSFFLVPIYSYFLTPDDYGSIDIVLTVVSMLYVFVSFQTIETVFRFIQDDDSTEKRQVTFSNAFITACIGMLMYFLCMMIINQVYSIEYCWLMILHVITNISCSFILQTIRGIGKVKLYALFGIVSTFIQAITNIILVVGFRIGAVSLLYAPIISNTVIFIIAIIASKTFVLFKPRYISWHVIKKQLAFSLPLMPNALCIWLTSVVGKYILLLSYEEYDVGLLTFSMKFSQLLITINSIFFMAWQMDLVERQNDPERDTYVSKISGYYINFLCGLVMVMLPVLHLYIQYFAGEAYRITWVYIAPFFIGVIFNSVTLFLNGLFYREKKTSWLFISTISSTVIYMILSVILIQKFYIIGIGIAYAVSELIRCIITYFRINTFSNVVFTPNIILKNTALLIASLFLYYICRSIVSNIVLFAVFGIVFVFNNKDMLIRFLKLLPGSEKIRFLNKL